MSDPFHTEFAAALTRGDPAPLATWLEPSTDARRFAVYRNNVVLSAIEALRAVYPAVNRLVGDSFFSPMARAYWQETPPVSRSMTLYGDGFASFARRYAPAGGLPYLEAVAEYDRAWLESHHAADDPPLDATLVAAMDAARLPAFAPRLHASARLLRHDWPGYEIWRRNRFDPTDGQFDVRAGDYGGLVWRQRGEVRHMSLDLEAWTFLAALGDGLSLAHAAADAVAVNADFDAAGFFGVVLADEILGGNQDVQ